MRGAPGGSLLAGGPAGAPPGTASRGGGGAAGAPPGTAYKRLGTASGARPGTGQQQAAAAAAAQRAGTAVQVENRPITNHGVSGMKVAASTGRQVLDKNYFMNELRQKRMEISQVTQGMKVRATDPLGTRVVSMARGHRGGPCVLVPLPCMHAYHSSQTRVSFFNTQAELEALERRQAQYNSMDKRGSDLSKEVKILQEALADYNTVLDKVGMGV